MSHPVKRRNKKSAFTFIELIVVLIIVAILAGLAIPNLTKTKERALDKEAQTALRLIQASEKIYNLKNSFYYPVPGPATNENVNSDLGLDLSFSSWNFRIDSVNGGADFAAAASRTDNSRVWRTGKSSANPVCSGTNCP